MTSGDKTDFSYGIGGIFVPAGIFIGIGIGYWLNNLYAGLFIGFGAGLAAFGLSLLIKR